MAAQRRSRQSIDEQLVPPRPAFLENRGSFSSADDSTTDSDRESPPQRSPVARAPVARAAHGRRRSQQYAALDTDEPWSAQALYSQPAPASPRDSGSFPQKPPPSSFAFPFQSHPGNPDPGFAIPGVLSRRSSFSSLQGQSSGDHSNVELHPLSRPNAPFMSESGHASPRSSGGSVYRGSVANALSDPDPRASIATNFRAPFLSPASRPSSSLWSPPSYSNIPALAQTSSPNGSQTAFPLPPSKPPAKSTRLANKLSKEDKPWMTKPRGRDRAAYWLTICCWLLGLLGAAALCYFGWNDVFLLKDDQICLYLDEDFTSSQLDTDNTWNYENNLGGFGNGEFEITSNSSTNSFIQNNELYIFPTLTSDLIGTDQIFNGGSYDLGSSCSTPSNSSACSVKSNGNGVVVNPVMSARINTQGKYSMTYGKVEVTAKLPTGDWLWPAIWMLPDDNSTTNPYGAWPMSGEIDIMEARGNGPDYGGQGNNYVRSSLNYGPLVTVMKTLFGWYSLKQQTFADSFHTYTLEWTPQFMRFYTDSRLHAMLQLTTENQKQSFWDRAGFPSTAQNGSTEAVLQNIYSNGSNSAPFDQPFYLIINLAAGGTSGWFPDGVGNKPWSDGSATAMHDFAEVQNTWYSTWPSSQSSRSFRISSVKMWKLKGQC